MTLCIIRWFERISILNKLLVPHCVCLCWVYTVSLTNVDS